MGLRELPIITDADRERLVRMIRSLRTVGDPFAAHLRDLEREVERAMVVPAERIGADVVTMNSRVMARDMDSGGVESFTLVYHDHAQMFDSRLSVLAPLGAAALGSRVGQVLEWRVPRGVRRLKVERIVYQPEAAGNFEL